jgi:hypothetical protein
LKETVDSTYGAIAHAGFTDRLRTAQRHRLFDAFKAFRGHADVGTTLCVGMAATSLFDNANCVMEWSSPQERARLFCHDIACVKPAAPRPYVHPDALERSFRSDSLRLPFADGEFDWVFCNEVIERMGTLERQYALVRELTRVSRKGVFLSTSNRWHPIEFNTALPFAHWLPDAWWRRVLRWAGRGRWASEHGFRLVDSKTLYKLASLLPGKPKNDVGHKRVFGIKAHFFLMVEKQPVEKAERKAA